MKTQIQKLNSSKLFYNKWPYRVECKQQLASRAVYLGDKAIEEWISGERKLHLSASELKNLDKSQLLTFAKAIKSFLKKDYVQVRVEGSHFNLFCSDQKVLEEIDDRLHPWIVKINGPTTAEEHEFLMSNGHKKILCDTLPKDNYKYRVFFNYNFPKEQRQSFLSWTKNYQDKIIISNASERWLSGGRFYTQNPFMYVKDDKMLSMIGIYLIGHVKKVEEFIERNTVLVA